jgi:hypothetical protein
MRLSVIRSRTGLWPSLLWRFAVVVALGALSSGGSYACSCMRIGPACEAAWLQADAVFVGRVYWTDWRSAKVGGISTVHRIVTVKTLEPFVGGVSGWVSVETGSGGGDCGYDFGLGEKYLIYAHRQKDSTLITSICSRTQKASDANTDLTYLRAIKSLPDTGRMYGTVKQYTLDPNFKPGEVSIMSPYGGPEEQLFSMRPLGGTKLRLKRVEDASEQTTLVGQNGDFAFESLVAGKYQLSADLPPLMKPWEASELTIPAKGCSEVSVRTTFNGRLTGKVTDKAGVGIPYADVEVVRASEAENAERAFRWINANKDGKFEIGPLPPDDYVVGVNIVKYSGRRDQPRTFYPGVPDARQAKRIHLREGELVEGLDFQLDLKISGHPSS